MRLPRTFSLYLSREILLFGSLSFLGVTTVLVSQQLLEQLDVLIAVDTAVQDYLRLLGFAVSMLAAYAAPISFAFGVTLAIGRLAANRETLAVRSCGIGLSSLLLPTCALAFGISALSVLLVMEVEPRARLDLRQLLADVALRGDVLKPGRFRVVHKRTIFVEEKDATGQLRGVMVHDSTNADRPYTAFAERGRLEYAEATGQLELALESGQILLDPDAKDPDSVQTVYFDGFTYMLDAEVLMQWRYAYRKPEELTFAEILDALDRIDAGKPLERLRKQERRPYEQQMHRRMALPVAPILFGLIAVPFGLHSERSGRSFGIIGCAVVVFGYYALMTLGRLLASDGLVTPALGYWAPNALLALVACLWFVRANRGIGE